MKLTALCLLALLPIASHAATPAAAADAQLRLANAGYTEVRDLEFEDGLWEAEVRRGNGYWSEVALDPRSGEVFDSLSTRPLVELPVLLAAIERGGYREVHDLDRDGALWEAEATSANGERVELRLSGYDGRILHVAADRDD